MDDAGEFDVIAIDGGARTEKSLIHFDAAADLDGADGIGGDGLIHVTEPGEAGRRAAGAALRDAIGLERAGGLENDFVDFAHGIDGIVGRFVVMLRD